MFVYSVQEKYTFFQILFHIKLKFMPVNCRGYYCYSCTVFASVVLLLCCGEPLEIILAGISQAEWPSVAQPPVWKHCRDSMILCIRTLRDNKVSFSWIQYITVLLQDLWVFWWIVKSVNWGNLYVRCRLLLVFVSVLFYSRTLDMVVIMWVNVPVFCHIICGLNLTVQLQ